MAGAGFKDFVAGDVLTADDVDTYLMQQSVMVFAGTAARGSAIPTPSEGMVTYLQDADELQVYTTDWTAVGGSQTGNVIQVVSTTKTDTFSTTSSSFVDITGLSVSITPRSTSSKILVMCSVMFGQSGDSAFQVQMVRNSTSIAVGDASSSRGRITLQHTVQGGDAFTQPTHSMTHLDSPSTTSATTYKLQARIDANTGYVNRTGNDADALTRGRGVSSITVMEIAG